MILENKKTRDIGDAKIVQKSMNGTTKSPKGNTQYIFLLS